MSAVYIEFFLYIYVYIYIELCIISLSLSLSFFLSRTLFLSSPFALALPILIARFDRARPSPPLATIGNCILPFCYPATPRGAPIPRSPSIAAKFVGSIDLSTVKERKKTPQIARLRERSLHTRVSSFFFVHTYSTYVKYTHIDLQPISTSSSNSTPLVTSIPPGPILVAFSSLAIVVFVTQERQEVRFALQ